MGGNPCRFRQFSFIEPILFVYSNWMSLMFAILSQYMYYRISEDEGFPYLNLTSGGSGCDKEQFGANSTLKELEIQVQTKSANLLIFYSVFSTITSTFTSLFMGSYSDKKGRKIVLIASLSGAFLETTLLAVLVHFKLNIYVVIAGGIVNGVTGSYTTLMMGLMSYLSDTVEKDKLSLRIAILQLFMFLAVIISQLTSGFWIEHLGFETPIWFLWGSLLLITLYTIFFVKETIEPKKGVKVAFLSMEGLKRNLRLMTKQRPGGRSNLLLLFIFFAINVFSTFGPGAVLVLYFLRSPLCWIPSILGYWLALHSLVSGLGSIAGIGILKRCCSEINITRIGLVSMIAGSLLLAFSDKTWMVFLVAAVEIFGSVVSPIMSSISSRLVSSEEQGVLFAVIGIITSLTGLVGITVFTAVYPFSLRFGFPGFVFVCAAGIQLGEILLTRWINTPPDVLNQTYGENKPENELQAQKLTEHQDQIELYQHTSAL